jgi:hypothetical protein
MEKLGFLVERHAQRFVRIGDKLIFEVVHLKIYLPGCGS